MRPTRWKAACYGHVVQELLPAIAAGCLRRKHRLAPAGPPVGQARAEESRRESAERNREIGEERMAGHDHIMPTTGTGELTVTCGDVHHPSVARRKPAPERGV